MAIASFSAKANMADLVVVTGTDLSSDNEISYDNKKTQILVIENNSAGNYTPVLLGSSAPSDYFCKQVGEIDLSAGKTLTQLADTEQAVFRLKDADKWLQGTVTLTPATAGVTAYIIEV